MIVITIFCFGAHTFDGVRHSVGGAILLVGSIVTRSRCIFQHVWRHIGLVLAVDSVCMLAGCHVSVLAGIEAVTPTLRLLDVGFVLPIRLLLLHLVQVSLLLSSLYFCAFLLLLLGGLLHFCSNERRCLN